MLTRSRELLRDSFTRLIEHVDDLTDGLTDEVSFFRPTPTANSIAWLIWHSARVQDVQLCDIAGVEQVWTRDGWVDRFGLDLPRDDTATGTAPTTSQGARTGRPAGRLLPRRAQGDAGVRRVGDAPRSWTASSTHTGRRRSPRARGWSASSTTARSTSVRPPTSAASPADGATHRRLAGRFGCGRHRRGRDARPRFGGRTRHRPRRRLVPPLSARRQSGTSGVDRDPWSAHRRAGVGARRRALPTAWRLAAMASWSRRSSGLSWSSELLKTVFEREKDGGLRLSQRPRDDHGDRGRPGRAGGGAASWALLVASLVTCSACSGRGHVPLLHRHRRWAAARLGRRLRRRARRRT